MSGFTPSDDFKSFGTISSDKGHWSELFSQIYSVGGGLYNVYFKIGIIMAVVGLVVAGIFWLWYAGNSRELPRIKDLVIRVCITLAIMVNLTGIVIIVANLGMDY